ncbi:MAG: nicotinate (nicotinamide) nucleotide adenylyltransferase [Anaerolineae bacterium]|nr:nicotinate (nicotinamide) nucleotide adenylyltransferase [Phycisphaerae bacterium]
MTSNFDANNLRSGSQRQPQTGLCFGGSFNPIHNGHLLCARAAAESRGFKQVVVIPSAQPPHKPQDSNLAAPEDRFAMARLACEFSSHGSIQYVPSDIEIARAGPSYTIETVRELRKIGWPEVWWLIGADMLNYLPKWHQAEQLIDECNFLILARPGVELMWSTLPPHFRVKLEPNVVPAPLLDISATDIRRRVREGLPIDDLTVPPVVEYIQANRLYQ